MIAQRRRRVAVEHVARTAVVDEDLEAEVADLGNVRVTARDHPRIGAGDALERDVRVERLIEARGLGARRRVAGEDEQVVGDPVATLGRQAAEPVEALLAELVVGPLDREPDLVRDALGHRGERGGVVEIGDRDVRVALDDERAVALELAKEVHDRDRVRAIEDVVACDEDRVRLLAHDRLADGLEPQDVAVDVGEDGDPDAHRERPVRWSERKAAPSEWKRAHSNMRERQREATTQRSGCITGRVIAARLRSG